VRAELVAHLLQTHPQAVESKRHGQDAQTEIGWQGLHRCRDLAWMGTHQHVPATRGPVAVRTVVGERIGEHIEEGHAMVLGRKARYGLDVTEYGQRDGAVAEEPEPSGDVCRCLDGVAVVFERGPHHLAHIGVGSITNAARWIAMCLLLAEWR
jgi:hypothetical protein